MQRQATFAIDLNATVFGMPRALFPAFGTDVLGGGAGVVGLLYAAPGIGALVGAVTSGWVGRVERQGRAVIAARQAHLDPIDAVLQSEGGMLVVPDGPGLGVEYDWDKIEAWTTETKVFE